MLEIPNGEWARAIVGTHRVQRIPRGSAARHTSTATIAVLDDEAFAFELDPADVVEHRDRGSGKGGQHQNTTDSAVTLVHQPTGERVHMEGRSQWNNRQRAWQELERRLKRRARGESASQQNDTRRRQITTQERSAKTFTHNEQRSEVKDHQTGRKWSIDQFQRGRF